MSVNHRNQCTVKARALAAVIVPLLVIPAAASAETALRVKGGYGVGGSYEIETDDGQKEEADLQVMAVSGTIIFNGAYADLSYSESSGDDLTYSNSNTGYRGPGGSLDRSDLALTIGTLGDISVFGGYRQGKSHLNNALDTVFETKGFFLGVSPSMKVAERSRVGMTAAMAFMNGKWQDNASGTASADYALGFSVGAAFGYQLNEQFGVGADVKYQSYSFDFTSDLGITVDETLLSYGLNANYRF